MNGWLGQFARLPRAVQAGAAIVLLGGLVGLLGVVGSPKAAAAFVAMTAMVGLLLIAYQWVISQSISRRSGPMEQALRESAGLTPVQISEPARRARLDDLRRSFESGVQKFKDSGKSLYALPWYVVVGEPGSGKTEAIRHCNVGFPPGLHDQLQGAGGTLNMNWWFTNHAVILDTAGRLMFEDFEPGSTGEWSEFLKLLKRSRPNCPVNGMLLVIPAESLIRDNSEAIERKAGKIARQLDQIQRTLGVRFPVYVVVTKCDLINGFREFFDDLTDPQLQHQILGWSNPATLDSPFNPEQVDQHIQAVRGRLLRRRLGLLADPVHRDDPRGRRTDEVDALYEFPDAFHDIAPRLKRYLSMIFVAGEWAARPLFLRGIYFTSSMREGEALDAKLAEALGVPVESLPEGRIWERDRSYFLRDLFTAKMFREKGLVTRAVSTSRQQSSRRIALLSASAAGVVALGALSYAGSSSLRKSLAGPTRFWSALSSAMSSRLQPPSPELGRTAWALPVVAETALGAGEFTYQGSEGGSDTGALRGLPVPPERRSYARLPAEVRERAEAPIGVPWAYRPIAMISGEFGVSGAGVLTRQRADAARAQFEAAVLRPVAEAARSRLAARARSEQGLGADGVQALRQLIRIEVSDVVRADRATLPDLAPLLQTALGEDAFVHSGAAADAAELQRTLQWLYVEAPGAAWPPEGLAARTGAELEGVVVAYGASSAADTGPAMRLIGALREFADAEQGLLRVQPSSEGWEGRWREAFAALSHANQRAGNVVAVLAGRDLKRAYLEEDAKFRETRRSEADGMLGEFKPLGDQQGPKAEVLAAYRQTLSTRAGVISRIDPAQAEVASQLAVLDATLVGDPANPALVQRYSMYSRVNRAWQADGAGGAADVEARAGQDLSDIQQAKPPSGSSGEPLQKAKDHCAAALDAALRARRSNVVEAALGRDLTTVAKVSERVRSLAAERREAPWQGTIPLTIGPVTADSRYAPQAAATVLHELFAASVSARAAGGAIAQRYRSTEDAAMGYLGAFINYWAGGGIVESGAPGARPWTTVQAKFAGSDQWGIHADALSELVRASSGAIEALGSALNTADRPVQDRLDVGRRLLGEARAALDSQDFQEQCLRALSRWKTLSPDAAQARQSLVAAVGGGGGLAAYLVTTSERNIAKRYWQVATLGALGSLADEAAAASDRALAVVTSLDRFPVARWSDERAELTLEELKQVRQALAQLPAGSDPVTLRACEQAWPGGPEVEDAVRRLLGCGRLSPVQSELVDRVRARIAAIPEEPGSGLCTITYLIRDSSTPGIEPVSHMFTDLTVGGRAVPLGTSGATFEPVRYPAAESRSVLVFKGAGATQEWAVPTRWLPLYLLDKHRGRPVDPGSPRASVWEVEVLVPLAGKRCSLWLRLDFESDQPPGAAWR